MKISAATFLSLSAYCGLVPAAVSGATVQKEIGDVNTCELLPKVVPYRYDMIIGPYKSFEDAIYDGSVIDYDGVTRYKGYGLGKGELVDGTIADEFYNTGGADYMGWIEGDLVDSKVGVDFYFDSSTVLGGETPINVVTFYFSDGDGSAGVCAPSAVYIEGVEYDLNAATDGTKQALQVTVYLETPFVGQTMHVEMEQTRPDFSGSKKCQWIFVSEVQFDRCVPDLPTASPTTTKSGKKYFSSSKEERRCGETIADEELLPYIEYLCTKLLP
jgi:hypothetical protein